MLINAIKTYAFNKLLIPIILAILLMLLINFLMIFKNDYINQYETYQNNIKDLQFKIDNLTKMLLKSGNNQKIWNETLSEIYSNRDNINLENVKQTIETLVGKYNISNFKLEITNPHIRSDLLKLEYVNVDYLLIEMNFNILTDKDILTFIKELTQQLKGVVNILNLEVSILKDSINTELSLPKVNQQLKSSLPVITVKLELILQNLVDKEANL